MLLVTGVAGFIGSNFCHYYLKKYKNSHILGLDKLTYAGDVCNITSLNENKKFHFIKGDITDAECINFIFDKYDISGVINFAAETHVDRSITNASPFIHSNICGVFNLMECIKNTVDHNIFRDGFKFIQISTDEVYGSVEDNKKFVETTLLHPNNPYSASKASADLLVLSYCNTYNFPGVISRCSNNFGPRQYVEKFIPTIITKAITHNSIPIYGNGQQIRDWIFVDNHCSAIDCILQNDCVGEIYNIGEDNEWKNIDIVTLILQRLQNICNDDKITIDLIEYVQDRPGHDKRYAMDATKIKKNLGWKPIITFEDGLKLTIDWYIDQILD
jgi:dTDP-glucose 4,6-dehydratase